MRLAPAPLLTREEEIALARRVHGPDRADALAARNELVTRNLGLVGQDAVRKRRLWSGSDYDDLFGEGMVGLIRAAELFDPDRHTRFSSYACKAIDHAMREYLKRDRTVHVPSYLQEPTQLAAAMKMAHTPAMKRRMDSYIRHARDALVATASVEEMADPDDPRPSPLDALIGHEDTAAAVAALGELPPLRAYILIHRLGLCGAPERTLRELGRELHVTHERIRQIEVEATEELGRIIARDQKFCA